MKKKKRQYNTDPELLHSFFLSFNRIADYHDSVCALVTQLSILAEFFDESHSEYDHNTILLNTRNSVIELYDKIFEENRMFDECIKIHKEIVKN